MSRKIPIKSTEVVLLPDGRLIPKHAGIYLGLSAKTLAMMRCAGNGPRFVKLSGRIFYFQQDLDAYVEKAGRVTSTAQARANSA